MIRINTDIACNRQAFLNDFTRRHVSKIKQGGEHRMIVDEQGSHAVSHFEPVEIFEHYSLMRIKIETGRMHQIRVHALHCGHPIAGDRRYGDKKQNQLLRTMGLKRLFLQACSFLS